MKRIDYKKMYLLLFDATARVIDLLITAHQEAEKLAEAPPDADIHLLRPNEDSEDD